MKLTIHIIVFGKDNLADRQSYYLALEGIHRIRRFRSMISGNNEKAMMFALSKAGK